MNLKRLVITAALLVAAFPASAAAAGPSIPPPEHDHFLQMFLPTESRPMAYNEPIIFSADTTTYTDQADMYDPPSSGGPAEPNVCVYPRYRTVYGRTMWFALKSRKWGRLSVTASGGSHDKVIGILPFRSLDNVDLHKNSGGTPVGFSCVDDDRGISENVGGVMKPGKWYAFQVGGTQGSDETSAPDGGFVQVRYNLRKPKQVGGRAFLFWNSGPLRVTKMYVTGVPDDATLKLSCTKGACRKHKVGPKGKVAVGKAGIQTRTPHGLKTVIGPAADTSPAAAFKPIVQSAGRRVNLKKYFKKKVKRGAKIELRITNFGQIGRYYRWKAKRNSITPATTRCMDVAKSKPKKKCHG